MGTNQHQPAITAIPMVPAITNKKQMYELLNAGVFGNRGESWGSLEEFLGSNPTDQFKYAIRSLVPGGKFLQPLTVEQVVQNWSIECANISVVQPHDKLTIQGELYHDGITTHLRWTTYQDCMRDAFKVCEQINKGLSVWFVLRAFMDEQSIDRLIDLSNCYPGHVIEFSHYKIPVGVEPYRLIIWEVRKY